MLYFADAPADTDFIAFLGGVPAPVVPQYWHRADGFDDSPIAHTESRQRVKFAREQTVAAWAVEKNVLNTAKNSVCFFIFSLLNLILSKIRNECKGKRFLI